MKHLIDPVTGLCHHMYSEPEQSVESLLWGRGNGWVVMSLAELLRHEPDGTEDREYLEDMAANCSPCVAANSCALDRSGIAEMNKIVPQVTTNLITSPFSEYGGNA